MMRFLNSFLKESVRAVAVLGVLVVFAVATYAFQEPASGPPAGGSVTAPVNTGNVSQTKAAGLTIQGLLWGNSVVSNTTMTSPQYCIGASCITAWSQAGGGGSGTVTSVGTNNGLVGGTITTSGTLGLNTAGGLLTCTNSTTNKLYWNGSALACGTDQGGGGSVPGGLNGAVQFNNTGAFGGDASNLFWDNLSKRLGIGTAVPQVKFSLGIDVTAKKLALYDVINDFYGFGMQPSRMTIYAGNAEQMTVTNAGNVGIGTANPLYKLDVAGGIKAGGVIDVSNGDGGADMAAIRSWNTINLYSTCCGLTTKENPGIQFRPRDGGAYFAGNVGIGTNAPAQKLHVVGNVNVTGCFMVNGVCISAGGSLSGSGSTNYISKWTGGTSLGNSIIFDTGSRVGIGTAAPLDPLGWASSLDVAGGMTASRYYDRQNTGYFVDLDAGANLSRDWLFGGSTVIEPSWDINTGVYSNRAINTGSTMSARDVWLTAPNFGSPRWASAPATGGTGLGAWEARSQGTTYTAATDGFVTATLDSGPDQGCKVGIETPQGIRRQWSWPNGDSPQVAMMSPVRRGDTYYIGGGFCPAMAIYWIPLGN